MKQSSCTRSGMTLLEVLIAGTLMVAVMGVLGVALARILKSDTHTAARGEGLAELGRLAEQFRDDVHAARQARIEPVADNRSQLILSFDEGLQVAYRLLTAGVERLETRGGAAHSREAYILSGMAAQAFHPAAEPDYLVVLTISRLARSQPDDPQSRGLFTIEARLGSQRALQGVDR